MTDRPTEPAQDPFQAVLRLLADEGISDTTRQAFTAVPRETFAPDVWWAKDDGMWRPRSRADVGDQAWKQALWAPREAMVTQVDGGLEPTPDAAGQVSSCSLSAPWIVADMLDAADIRPGDHILEIGAGQGWSAALAAHLAGPAGSVTTIEYDPALADLARTNLKRAGVRNVEVVTGDGRAGIPGASRRFDAVIATAAFDPIPFAWVRQAAIGARLVVPQQTTFYLYGMFVGSVGAGAVAVGRFRDDANFMWDRGLDRLSGNPWRLFTHQGEGRESTTALNPAAVRASDPAQFAIGRLMPGVYQWVGRYDEPERTEDWTWWLYDGTSWAAVDYTPGAEAFEVEQYGPRSLADEVQAAHDWWRDAGEPCVDRFGLLIDEGGQHLLLDAVRVH